jgi:divalent metal cation (Fe/Co/Zn/Cd) transporter
MRRHDFDALSFTFGLLFAVAGLALLGGSAVRDGLSIPWAGPVVAIGVALLIVFAARPREAAKEKETPDAEVEG